MKTTQSFLRMASLMIGTMVIGGCMTASPAVWTSTSQDFVLDTFWLGQVQQPGVCQSGRTTVGYTRATASFSRSTCSNGQWTTTTRTLSASESMMLESKLSAIRARTEVCSGNDGRAQMLTIHDSQTMNYQVGFANCSIAEQNVVSGPELQSFLTALAALE